MKKTFDYGEYSFDNFGVEIIKKTDEYNIIINSINRKTNVIECNLINKNICKHNKISELEDFCFKLGEYTTFHHSEKIIKWIDKNTKFEVK